MKTTASPPLIQESLLFEAIALLEAGRAPESLSILDLLDVPAGPPAPPDGLLTLSLARSLRAHAQADLDQHQQALTCLEGALSLVDPVAWLMEQVWCWLTSARPGLPDGGQLPPLPTSFQDLVETLPAEATEPILLCCKAEGLYVHHEFEEAASLLGFACAFDAWRGLQALPRAFYASNCALASYKAGDADLALDLSAAALECLEAGSPLAGPVCYNRAALLWDLEMREEATALYRKALACDATDGRACLAQWLSAEQVAIPAPQASTAEPVARQRATHTTLYDAEGWEYDGESDRPRIWIPLFAAWRWQEANRVV